METVNLEISHVPSLSPSRLACGRASGILCHISSLPSAHGIGDFGQAARDFVDFLVAAGQKVWQILPLGTTGYGDSPYQNFSIFAGNPYFIDLEDLVELGLLEPEALRQVDFGDNPSYIDYAKLWTERRKVLNWAWDRFKFDQPQELKREFLSFQEEAIDWLNDYALFMTIKEEQGGLSWQDWPEELKKRQPDPLRDWQKNHQDRIEFYAFCQFLFFKQWRALKSYANERGISILGDMPIYIAIDSVEAWMEPQFFMLDEDLRPTFVAGCPPDGFTEDGQLWGNPLYDWEQMQKEGFGWWEKRFRTAFELYDLVRIDHFRAFDSYWAVPFGDETARRGTYLRAPGHELFLHMQEVFGENLPVVAEDLGLLTQAVHDLRNAFQFPGMKILQFAFFPGNDSEYLPHHMVQNCVAYTGTHDNDTLAAWLEVQSEGERDFLYEYFGLGAHQDVHRAVLRNLQNTVADLVIMQVQDLLRLGNEARLNRPGEASGNWQWRLLPGQLSPEIAAEFKRLSTLAGRV